MRTFIALELSEEVQEELARIQGNLKYAGADIKWAKPDNIHLTLKFLGEVEENKLGQIKNILDRIASDNKPFELKLFKLGGFPSLDQPRVLWVGTDNGCVEAETIARSIEEGLEKIGFPKEDRPFRVHLTLGRLKSGKNKVQLRQKLLSLEVQPKSCAIRHITLFQSTLTPSGPIYKPLHISKLG
ncbi:MAG: 2'-5' RNA ligase [Omnitrophica bacterium RBG_13_46_9]|nr:MAG: 2'-5' RNA ligase [Omnitrophica bacterium RBG_13_46_9]